MYLKLTIPCKTNLMKAKYLALILFIIPFLFSCDKDDYYDLNTKYLLTNDRGQEYYNENGIELNLDEFKWHLLIDGGFILTLSGSSNGDSILLDGYINNHIYKNKLTANLNRFSVFDSIPFTYPDDDKEYNVLKIQVYKNSNILEVIDTCRFK